MGWKTGVFEDGVWYCDCRPPTPAAYRISKTKKNPNRAFRCCSKRKGEECRMWEWEDDLKARERHLVSAEDEERQKNTPIKPEPMDILPSPVPSQSSPNQPEMPSAYQFHDATPPSQPDTYALPLHTRQVQRPASLPSFVQEPSVTGSRKRSWNVFEEHADTNAAFGSARQPPLKTARVDSANGDAGCSIAVPRTPPPTDHRSSYITPITPRSFHDPLYTQSPRFPQPPFSPSSLGRVPIYPTPTQIRDHGLFLFEKSHTKKAVDRLNLTSESLQKLTKAWLKDAELQKIEIDSLRRKLDLLCDESD